MNTAVETLVARADRALSAMHEASEGLSGVRVVHRSADGLAVVTADGTGALVGLELADDVSRVSPARLSETIIALASEAAREALEHRASLLEQMQSSLSET